MEYKSAPGFAGLVTEFEVEDDYISKFEVRTVGSGIHQELWVPAEELDEFNRHIIGSIKVIEAYYGENYQGRKYEFSPVKPLTAVCKTKSIACHCGNTKKKFYSPDGAIRRERCPTNEAENIKAAQKGVLGA